MEWGKRGAREAANRGDIVIIVDVLSFSSTVVTGLNYGAIIYPYPPHLNGKAYAQSLGAQYILGRAEAARLGAPTLSPVTFNHSHDRQKYVLSSLNGAFCTWIASHIPALFIGSLLNASAVASAANQLSASLNANITVVPCGELWNGVKEFEDSLRPAMEDYLGAGAILSRIEGKQSAEVQVCIGAFQHSKSTLSRLIWDCTSGIELRERGFEKDVKHCSRLNIYQTVPILKNQHFSEYTTTT
ncbi:2-phosphosulfolactate phosphatase [Cytobacillus kochii]|uniref:2-phosphosulfolactate phosphatase n=1 Tax=Cytobacillus kochii TaxID=859143 RepID=UPI0024805805|nr:2-phosphosulfolactate phosphatase [Cytobacillus kochii]